MAEDPVEVGDGPGVVAPARSFSPRRGLPNGRAILGAVLVTAAAVGAFALATSGNDGPTTEYLVVVHDVAPGEALGLDDVEFEAMTLTPTLADAALVSTNGLDGATALRFLRAGELLVRQDLNGAPFVDGGPVTAIHEVTIPVPIARTPGQLVRGDRVTILAYDDTEQATWVAVEDALVLDFDDQSGGIGTSTEGRLTLGLATSAEVIRAGHLSFLDITVVLTTGALDDDYPDFYRGPASPDTNDAKTTPSEGEEPS